MYRKRYVWLAPLVIIVALTSMGEQCDCDKLYDSQSELVCYLSFDPPYADGDSVDWENRTVWAHCTIEHVGAVDLENMVRIFHNEWIYTVDPTRADNFDFNVDAGRLVFDYPLTLFHGTNTFYFAVFTPEWQEIARSETIILNGNWDPSQNPLHVRLFWDTDSSDVDLHGIAPDGSECWYHAPDGGGMRLDVDDVDGYGPENMTVEIPQYDGNGYQYFVRYYDAHGQTADVNVTVQVYQEEVLTNTYTHIFTQDMANQDDPGNDWYLPDKFTINQP